jgi:hypothetical protein
MSPKICLRCDWQGESTDPRCPNCGVQPLYVVGPSRSRHDDAAVAREPDDGTREPASAADSPPTSTAASPPAVIEASGTSVRPAVVFVVGALVLTVAAGAWLTANEEPSGGALASATPASEASPAGPASQELEIVDLDGALVRTVGGFPEGAHAPSLSPDGASIAFVADDGDATQRVMTIGIDGSGLRLISPPGIDTRQPAWSPDGTSVVFAGEPAVGPGPSFEIYTVDADGSGLRQITLTDEGLASDPQWSPDGSTIVYARFRSLGNGNYEGDIWSVSPTSEFRLTSTPMSDWGPAYSPHGSQIAFSREGRIWVMGADGADPRVVTADGYASAPSWSPDGSMLAYLESEANDEADPQRVIVIELATGERHPVRGFTVAGNAPVWWANDRLLLLRAGVDAGSSPTPTPGPSAPSPDALGTATIEPEPVSVGRQSFTVNGIPLSFGVPSDGWSRFGDLYISQSTVGSQAAEAIIFWTGIWRSASARACGQWWGNPDASAAQIANNVSRGFPGTIALIEGPMEVAIGGYAAQHVAFVVLSDVDSCDPGFFHSWDAVNVGDFWAGIEVGDTVRIWLVEVGGEILYIEADTHENAGADVKEEIDRVVASMEFD